MVGASTHIVALSHQRTGMQWLVTENACTHKTYKAAKAALFTDRDQPRTARCMHKTSKKLPFQTQSG